MNRENPIQDACDAERAQSGAAPETFDAGRRSFMKLLGAGLLVTVAGETVMAQGGGGRGQGGRGGRGGGGGRGGFGGGGSQTVAARIHIGEDGTITVMTGKVEEGQGARAELSQAAAEELRVPVGKIHLIMADTALVPNDGMTAGSQTTPQVYPQIRRAAAAARVILTGLAAAAWAVAPEAVEVHDGVLTHKETQRQTTYGELAKSKDAAPAFQKSIPQDVTVTPVSELKVVGTPVARPNYKDILTGAHKYPSDIIRPGMLYGKVLRAPSFGAKLTGIDLAPAKALKGVVVVRDGDFVGCAAPTSYLAAQAVEELAKTAKWQENTGQPSNKNIFEHLKQHARGGTAGAVGQALSGASKKLSATYTTAYIQHVPLEPRASVAEWEGSKLTVWDGTGGPFGVRGELAAAFGIPAEDIHVIVPDMGGSYGGKHRTTAAVEAARLAKGAGKPVHLRWTRQEEFTWAYFRPAALIEIEAGLDAKGALVAWDFTNINSGGSGLVTPYNVPASNMRNQTVNSDSPLYQSSYRVLAATANNFARESFMDELAAAAGADPLAFRLGLLDPAGPPLQQRLRAVLEAAAKKFGWEERKGKKVKDVGIGLSCGNEKGSVVAACVEVAVDRAKGTIELRRVVQAFECGKIVNPGNLRSQVEGCIIMGLGGALTEEMLFENGKILNASLSDYQVPRFKDVPPLELVFLDRPDMVSAGAGETPIIAIAPAIGNAIFNAIGVRLRAMPMRGEALKQA